MNKGYRVNTKLTSDTYLNVNMKQDFDFLEVLSLKLRQKDTYRLHSSNYGVIVGRVLANDAFGIPNAKVSVFIEKDGTDSREIENIYPYSEVTSKDRNARRYNLLPDYSDDDCYRVVGTFPNKRLLLDDDIQLEIYEKYWKYTTVTNNAGDYMLFGVPTGSVTVHIDIDLSDIGILSQKPYDFLYKGHNLSEFDSTTQFKESTNLDYLTQIITQNKSVYVYPFWGDADNGIACITRSDIQIEYQFETTCIFMGSIISDNGENSINNNCGVNKNNGMNDQLVTSNGTIEMIRRTTDGLVEEFPIKSNYLIDNDGVWCYQIPMNLDYIGTDEYGNIVPTDNPNRGIATRAQVRFRISKDETNDEGFSRHTAKYLVPMNPILNPQSDNVKSLLDGEEVEKMYQFGSRTPSHCFRDLYWNNVYSVKNHIPKTQTAHRPDSPNYSALKGANHAGDKNAIPFNKLAVDLSFVYMLICLIFTLVIDAICRINRDIIGMLCVIISTITDIVEKIPGIGWDLDWCPNCINFTFGDELFAPCCCQKIGGDAGPGLKPDCDKVMPSGNPNTDSGRLLDLAQRELADRFKAVRLDFYEDWVNGTLYMPLWYWRKRKKKSYLFGLIHIRAKNDFCDCDNTKPYRRLKTYYSCNFNYRDNTLEVKNGQGIWSNDEIREEEKWHKRRNRSKRYFFRHGLIKQVENMDGLNVYYYTAIQPTTDNGDPQKDYLVKDFNNGDFFAAILYATDIILLGNLNEENLWGLPQFFTSLPQTTSNVPPMGSITHDDVRDEERDGGDDNTDDDKNNEWNGTILTTGMDWGEHGKEKIPERKSGLFLDLSCLRIDTRLKACFNVERLSELGASLDGAYRMSYSHKDDKDGYPDMYITNDLYGHNMDWIEADGFITKYELDDTYNRSAFATMNHLGFIPREAINEINEYLKKRPGRGEPIQLADTQIEDADTGYLIPKFKEMFLVDFDGRLDLSMDWYAREKKYDQASWDEKDDAYITFRLGAERDNIYTRNNEWKVRHFYYTLANGNDGYRMPYYNNSFYFYFGLTPGKTAIDKFNEEFYSVCSRKDVDTFSINVNTQGVPYNPSSYLDPCRHHGYIHIKVDSINKPYSFKLYNVKNEVIQADEEVYVDSFAIGSGLTDCQNLNLETETYKPYSAYTRQYDSSKGESVPTYITDLANTIYAEGTRVSSGVTGTVSSITTVTVIDNSTYTLEVTDANGETISQKIDVGVHKLGFIANVTFDKSDIPYIEVREITIGGVRCIIDRIANCEYNGDTDTYDSWITLHNDIAKPIFIFAQFGCITHHGNPIEDVDHCCFDDDTGADPCHTLFQITSEEPYLGFRYKPDIDVSGPCEVCARKWTGNFTDDDGHNDTYILTMTEAWEFGNPDSLNHENSASEIFTFDEYI